MTAPSPSEVWRAGFLAGNTEQGRIPASFTDTEIHDAFRAWLETRTDAQEATT